MTRTIAHILRLLLLTFEKIFRLNYMSLLKVLLTLRVVLTPLVSSPMHFSHNILNRFYLNVMG